MIVHQFIINHIRAYYLFLGQLKVEWRSRARASQADVIWTQQMDGTIHLDHSLSGQQLTEMFGESFLITYSDYDC